MLCRSYLRTVCYLYSFEGLIHPVSCKGRAMQKVLLTRSSHDPNVLHDDCHNHASKETNVK